MNSDTDIGGCTVLLRAPELDLRLKADGGIECHVQGQNLYFGPHTLALLDAFAKPQTVKEVVDNLSTRATGARDWVDLMSTVVQLFKAGILLSVDNDAVNRPPIDSGFADPAAHVHMLNDRRRTSAYIQAIHATVREGDVVVDIGTGTGVLALAAAQAGARKVYAIEASKIADAAEFMFASNGVSEQVELLRGWSTGLSLPEPAAVLISEVVGNTPLSEGILETTIDAAARFLKPGARFIPNRLRIMGQLISIPSKEIHKRTFAGPTLSKWKRWYGMEFGRLADYGAGEVRHFSVASRLVRKWECLSDPFVLADLNLTSVTSAEVSSQVEARVVRAGDLTGVITFFELDLGAGITLSTNPATAPPSNHWQSPVYYRDTPEQLKSGDQVLVSYAYSGKKTSLEWESR
ncbi:MAG: hypothetical protein GY906_37695 [bacterium]|nr:hypothetical protein [bacterium]